MPAVQLAQMVAPASACLPGWQTEQELALVTLPARPAAHCVHSVTPATLNMPLPHALHAVRLGWKPLENAVHCVPALVHTSYSAIMTACAECVPNIIELS